MLNTCLIHGELAMEKDGHRWVDPGRTPRVPSHEEMGSVSELSEQVRRLPSERAKLADHCKDRMLGK